MDETYEGSLVMDDCTLLAPAPWHPQAGIDYPSDQAAYNAWFPTDEECRAYLEHLRWPGGKFVCPKCRSERGRQELDRRWRCYGCRSRISVTSGTIFDKTRIPLSVWFQAAWLFTTAKTGVNATTLHKLLPINTYQTTWAMLNRFRQAMMKNDSGKLSGRVEIDETFIGGPRPGKAGRGASGKTMVICAVEAEGNNWGRARMAVIPNAKTATLRKFITENIEPGTTIVSDALVAYPGAVEGYVHERVNVKRSPGKAHNHLPAVHRCFASLKNLLLGQYQGGNQHEHLPEYVGEWVFRFNRRNSNQRGLLFMRLLQRCVDTEPVHYEDMIMVKQEDGELKGNHGRGGSKRVPGTVIVEPVGRPWLASRYGLAS